MKKLGMFLVGLFAVGLVTGCGSAEKTLICTMPQNESGLAMEQKVEAVFNGKKVTSLKLVVDSKAEDDAIKENWSTFSSVLKSQFEGLDADGIVVSTKDDSKNYIYTVTVDVDVTKAKDEDLKNFSLDGISSSKESIEDVKKQLEDAKYTCEIK